MAGYGGFQNALNIEPFDWAASTKSGLDIARSRGIIQDEQEARRQAALINPFKVEGAKSELEGGRLQNDARKVALTGAQEQGAVATREFQKGLIAEAAALIDPNAPDAAKQWDDRMKKALAQGAEGAGQFIGRYSPALQQRIVGGFSAQSPLAAQAAMASDGMGASPLAAIAGGAAQPAERGRGEDWVSKFRGMTPDQLQPIAHKISAIKDGLLAVANSPNPAATWDLAAERMGHPEWKGHYSPDRAKRLWLENAPLADYLEQRLTQAEAGVPEPVVAPQIKEASGVLYAIDPQSGEARAITKPPGNYSESSAIGPDFKPYVFNKSTGELSGSRASNAASSHPALDEWVTKIIGAENNTGDPAAKNPRSTATGNGQFIDSTWLSLMREERPDLVQGKTNAEILKMRSDPALSAQMIQVYGEENAARLEAAGIQPSGATLALAHRLGPRDALAVITAPQDKPLRDILSKEVMAANPDLKDKNAKDFAASMVDRFGKQPISFQGGETVPDPNATGDAFLKTLNPQMAATVKALAEGRQQFPASFAVTKPYWQQMLAAVGQYDPSFNQQDYQSRQRTRTAFTAGPEAKNITALNTAIGHLGTLQSTISALGNGPLLGVNQAVNWWRSNTGDPRVKLFESAKTAVVDELTRVFRGSAGSVHDIKEWSKVLDVADSPAQMNSVVNQFAELLDSRVAALTEQYANGMGTINSTPPGLNPHAIEALDRMQGRRPAVAEAPNAPPAMDSRVKGRVYETPRGPARWVGNGWELVNGA